MSTSLRGFGQFLAFLPHQLGFVPDSSVVIAGMRERQLCGLLRLDEDPAWWSSEAALEGSTVPILRAMRSRGAPDSAVVVFYRPDCLELDKEAVLGWVAEEFLPVQHAFVVAGDVWWAIECLPGCCDGALQPLPNLDPAWLWKLGVAQHPARSREEAVASLERCDAQRGKAVAAKASGQTPTATDTVTAWNQLMNCSQSSDDALAVVVAALPHPSLRDQLLALIVPEMLNPGSSDPTLSGLRQSAQHVTKALEYHLPAIPRGQRPRWLAMLALARWRLGDHCGAGLAAEQSCAEDPHLRLGALATGILQHGMPYPRQDPGDAIPDSSEETCSSAQDVDVSAPDHGKRARGFVP